MRSVEHRLDAGVNQPCLLALSMGIATLERPPRHRMIERDRRYIGLTAEGSATLP